MKQKQAVVVIPIHSPFPSQEEILSFSQCFKILSLYDIVVVHPEGLDLSSYKNSVNNFKSKPISTYWQSSLKGYNLLKTNRVFYDIFKQYQYLLTYELDAFVFKNELDYWCNKEYDYVGAPWIEGWNKPRLPINIIGVGNSGFSLRNVNSCLRILKRIDRLKTIYKFYNEINVSKNLKFKYFLKYSKLYKLFYIKNFDFLEDILSGSYSSEDGFWAIWVANTFKDFNVAPVNDALQFSFEVEPKELYSMNKEQLPFGCHAWMKYNPEFWGKFINYAV